ncbi:hypothetical protein IMZ08_06895 [Bacillus luteolus]|uniref:NADH dehydrogenase subunit 6 n=1 Tax=Litchfieldia luteola TaxID=682179 RepID=A0ABR9QH13_9BACI|nr:hypothetical protein [Cytobacillus luteolus]MBE4907781.1 hypothetical protein [Cytobacillus luteolus]MBP1944130.1 hypothetical protein [Cytobacillus luteolus]
MVINTAKLEIFVGALAIITGFTYVLGVFGPTEAEVSDWGFFAAVLGGIMIYFRMNKSTTKTSNLIKTVFAFLLLLIQIPAVILWFMFSGSGISDGSPASDFVAHWIYAVPHIAIIILGLLVILFMFTRKTV